MPSISFILNDRFIKTESVSTLPLVDYIRQNALLKATKIGCREGDCGACTVIVGTLEQGEIQYRTSTSCLMPIGNAHGKHIITLEGLTPPNELNPVQAAFVQTQATQCGFCTPGFIVSLSAAILSSDLLNEEQLLTAIDGNICRCTGYQSILRAVRVLVETWNGNRKSLRDLKDEMVLFDLEKIKSQLSAFAEKESNSMKTKFVAGGTDYMVQHGYPHMGKLPADLSLQPAEPHFRSIEKQCDGYVIGAGVTVTQLMEDPDIKIDFPELNSFFYRISSTPIRNDATIGGNLVNASPIADFAMILLVLDAVLLLKSSKGDRKIALKNFYLDYKKLDLNDGEWVHSIWIPQKFGRLNFEKISKRDILDIASVNSGAQVLLDDGTIKRVLLSAGGVAPIPTLLNQTQSYLTGKELTIELLKEALEIAGQEIKPISDIRGSADYKRGLLKNLVLAHFHELAPETISGENLW